MYVCKGWAIKPAPTPRPQRQWLNKCVMWTRDLLGRCLRYSFGMPSIPQALPTFRDQISLQTSHGRNLTEGFSSTVVSRAWTQTSTRHSWSASQNLCGVNRFSKQFAIVRFSLYSLNMDCTENITYKSSSIVVCITVSAVM
jgi:hypothetical protein